MNPDVSPNDSARPPRADTATPRDATLPPVAVAGGTHFVEAANTLSGPALTQAAAGAADRTLAKVFDAEAKAALAEVLLEGAAGEGGRPPEWDTTLEEPDTWGLRVRTAVREATWEALCASMTVPEGAAGDAVEEDNEPYYEAVEDFVSDFLAPSIERKMAGSGRGLTWCPQWLLHPEAVGRMMALWEAWETLRRDGGTAMSNWWSAHCDHHLGVLMNAEVGPFHLCKPARHGGLPATLRVDPSVRVDRTPAPEDRTL